MMRVSETEIGVSNVCTRSSRLEWTGEEDSVPPALMLAAQGRSEPDYEEQRRVMNLYNQKKRKLQEHDGNAGGCDCCNGIASTSPTGSDQLFPVNDHPKSTGGKRPFRSQAADGASAWQGVEAMQAAVGSKVEWNVKPETAVEVQGVELDMVGTGQTLCGIRAGEAKEQNEEPISKDRSTRQEINELALNGSGHNKGLEQERESFVHEERAREQPRDPYAGKTSVTQVFVACRLGDDKLEAANQWFSEVGLEDLQELRGAEMEVEFVAAMGLLRGKAKLLLNTINKTCRNVREQMAMERADVPPRDPYAGKTSVSQVFAVCRLGDDKLAAANQWFSEVGLEDLQELRGAGDEEELVAAMGLLRGKARLLLNTIRKCL